MKIINIISKIITILSLIGSIICPILHKNYNLPELIGIGYAMTFVFLIALAIWLMSSLKIKVTAFNNKKFENEDKVNNILNNNIQNNERDD